MDTSTLVFLSGILIFLEMALLLMHHQQCSDRLRSRMGQVEAKIKKIDEKVAVFNQEIEHLENQVLEKRERLGIEG